ncbi:DNA replication protein [Gracilibacillus halotolerans]|uniref:DNA replication protein n=1 Tax=Gracilibacillus halotolerans TaxID=74386 RepID=A0A841RG77_9BACI|nr:DnaD domain-containing protein [Gracilibacillus halotolerans]MBB6511621.1 DNA replication protein [Gracilibacillus halotolerans]
MTEIKLDTLLANMINLPKKLLTDYKKIGLNEQQLAILLQIQVAKYSDVYFPTPEELANHVTMSKDECSMILQTLIQHGYLEIIDEEDRGIRKEIYSLEPLWNKLLNEPKDEAKEIKQDFGELFQRFETEFGRPLSPFEIELINQWIDEDQNDVAIILAALREAVLMSKLNFKYIDRILSEWRRKGIKTEEQAKETSRGFHKVENKPANKQNSYDKSLYYNWLEE